MDKNILNVLAEIDEINPYATFLDQSTLSSVTDYIDTGSMPLNAVISGSLYGGIPRNRLTMLCGESMTGKTYIVIRTLANAQKKGLIPVIFDTENAIDEKVEKFFLIFKEKEKMLEEKNKVIFVLQQRVSELENKIQHMIALPDYNKEKQEAIIEKQKLEEKIGQLKGMIKNEKLKNLIFI